MEDNSFLIKVMAGALILILALNVYRTESTKKQMDRLAATVDSLTVRVGALENPDFSGIVSDPLSASDAKKVSDLAKGLSQLQSKVSALQGKVDGISSTPSAKSNGAATVSESGKEVSDLAKSVSDLQAKVNTMQKTVDRLSSGQRQASSSQGGGAVVSAPSSGSTKSSGRVSVTSKVKVEDRYVEKDALPQVSTGPEGTVIVSVTIDPGGSVSSARIGSGTTIKDEDILDKCKEAALKTRFNINVYVGSKHPATITYTFTAR